MIKLIILALWGFSVPQQDSVLTMEEAVSIALEYNYDIRLSNKELEIAENNNTLGNAGFLPLVEGIGSTGKSVQNTRQQFLTGEGQSVNGAERTFVEAGAFLEWTLFDGLRMFATKERLEKLQVRSLHELKFQVQNTVAEVLYAFYNAALEQERLNLLTNTMELSEERVRIIREKYEIGKASRLEYLQAQVDYNTDRSAFVKQKEVISTSKYALWQLLAQDTPPHFTLSYELEPERGIALETVIAKAHASSPELLALQANREVALLSIKEEQRERYPDLDFNLGYTYSNIESEAGFLISNRTSGLNYGFTATVPIFDGFNKNRVVQNAQITSEMAVIGYEKARNRIETAIRAAYLSYQNSIELIRLEKENQEVARENNEIAQERFRIGISDALEVREAQNNALNAEIRYLEALNDAKQAEIDLKRLSGSLVE